MRSADIFVGAGSVPSSSTVQSDRTPAEERSRRRPPAFDAEAYKQRTTVERCIARFKQWRGLAMRTDKLALAYRAALHLAAILIWARR